VLTDRTIDGAVCHIRLVDTLTVPWARAIAARSPED
jgi:hypothetical protein